MGVLMAMGRPKAVLVLSPQQREQLEGLANSRSLPAGLVSRARIILLSASGKTSCAVGAPPSMKIEFSGLVRGVGSVCGTSNIGWRLLRGRESSVRTSIPSVRLTRVGKGTTFCRTQRLGRTYSSVCNGPTAQQSPPLQEALCKL